VAITLALVSFPGLHSNAVHKLQAYYLIQAAQQREELVVEADALRETIAAAERDEAALTAAAGQLLDGNERLDDSFRHASGVGFRQGLGSRSAPESYPRPQHPCLATLRGLCGSRLGTSSPSMDKAGTCVHALTWPPDVQCVRETSEYGSPS